MDNVQFLEIIEKINIENYKLHREILDLKREIKKLRGDFYDRQRKI